MWRGPTGQGRSAEKNLPLTWSDQDNVRWKVPLPHAGSSTPIVWGDRIFLTQANPGGTVRALMCFARSDGRLLWKQEVAYPAMERTNNDRYCNASPATDGARVVVSHGSAGLYCYDLAGKELWKRTDLGKWNHEYGNASSPVLHGERVILWCGPDYRKNTLLAVDRKTGATVWEHQAQGGSWSTPLIVRVGDRDQLLLSMPFQFKGFDPKTGQELWSCDGLGRLVYTSPLHADGIAVAMSGYGGPALAVPLGGKGDVTADRLWHHPRNKQRVGSGAIVGEHIYMLEENCVPRCYELKTGKEVWQVTQRPRGTTWSSMVAADGRLYVLTQQGDTHVIAANPARYELLATNRLGEDTNASIAISDGELFIRTSGHLWCISAKK
jgi:outer membrane protein assembly factor BamB